MSSHRLNAVRKVLHLSTKIADWYSTEHKVSAGDFTASNVREYGLTGLGELADMIIADGEAERILAPGEAIDD